MIMKCVIKTKKMRNTVGLLNKSAFPNPLSSNTPTTVLVSNATEFISRFLNKSVRHIEKCRSALIKRPAYISRERAFR